MSGYSATWTRTELGKIAEFVMGQAPPGVECNFAETGTPFVKAGEFGETRPIIREWTTRPLKQALASDVLICVVGATSGKLNLGANCAIGRSVAAIRPRPATFAEFLYYQLLPKVLELRQRASGSAQGVISKELLGSIPIVLPPLEEQRCIVAKLDSLLGRSKRARDELTHVPRLVERCQEAIFDRTFCGTLTKAAPTPRSIRSLIKSLDQGWSPKCLSRPSVSNEWAVIKTTAIQPVRFDPSENKALPASLAPRPNLQIVSGDVLITRAGPRSRVGISCVVDECPPHLMLCDKAYRLRVDRQLVEPSYLAMALNSPRVLSIIERLKTGMSDSGLNLTQTKFLDVEIPWVPLSEQRCMIDALHKYLTSFERVRRDVARTMALLDRLNESILTKAFQGDLLPISELR
jgi:type I restriction enzyme S subunit